MTSVLGLTSLLLKHFRQKATAEEGTYLFSIHFSTALWALKPTTVTSLPVVSWSHTVLVASLPLSRSKT
jgi:hypothetical protein